MHKSVRYYITESNDQPVVRSVEVSMREAERAELNADDVNTSSSPHSRIRLNRSSLPGRLKTHRPRIKNS